MNDLELLELAAKAAGLHVKGWVGIRMVFFNPITGSAEEHWNPLTDDGDALRLAVALKLEIERSKYSDKTVYVGAVDSAPWKEEACAEVDIYAATRRAIVLAAAQIGQSM